MILHADGNSFYASCEQIYRPDLRGKPVAVLSNNDGIIIALNKEAKACGIKRGDPYFKVRDICQWRGITVFSSNYTLYADISRRITSIYRYAYHHICWPQLPSSEWLLAAAGRSSDDHDSWRD